MILRVASWAAIAPLCALAALRAGTASADVTDHAAGPVNDPALVKVLALEDGALKAAIVTVDAVSFGEIGYIDGGYIGRVRAALEKDLGIPSRNVFFHASHCHAVVRKDADQATIQAAKEAWSRLTPVRAGAGRGREDRIMENRRMYLRDGRQTDVRRAYAMPNDPDVASTGPVDPEIGILRLDRLDGRPLAVLYNFAAHPIQGVPGGGNSADYPGFASRVIEENLGGGAMAFFIQGCAGDINPAKYKDVHSPHDAEPLGNLLGLSVLRAARAIQTVDAAPLRILNETLTLPRAADRQNRISAMKAERERLVKSLSGTSLNFRTFLELYLKYKLSPDAPSYYAHRYLHEKAQGREDLRKLDEENRANMEAYLRGIQAMEEISRLNANLALLEMHEKKAAGRTVLDVEVGGLRIGDFRLVTFPGELTVEIGLGLKKRAPGPFTFVAGYANGYIYYTATVAQRTNKGWAQEDCDAMVAPEWQALFEQKALAILGRL